MGKNINKKNDNRVTLTGRLSEFREALEDEIDEIKNSGQSSTLLQSGSRIEHDGPDFWYRFRVEYAPTLPADTPCNLIIGQNQYNVTVVSFEESAIFVSSNTPLPENLGKARLENGATILMERLVECIENNAEIENKAGMRMLPPENESASFHPIFSYSNLELNETNNKNQNDAIKSALTNDITYIWGPPGTGKTSVIGQIINNLYKNHRSVLVVSHTNTAVDGAIEKADKACEKNYPNYKEEWPILRIGTPVKKLNERVLLAHHIEVLGKELYKQEIILKQQQQTLQNRIKEIQRQFAKIIWLKESKLVQINELYRLITEEIEPRISAVESDIEKLKKIIEEEKAAHPEYSEYISLTKTIEARRNDYETVCELIRRASSTANELNARIIRAQDEIKKHGIYAQLQAREASFMSESFIRNELLAATAHIKETETQISNLLNERAKTLQILVDYKNKSSLAKLFTAKSTPNQAQARLQEIEESLSAADMELKRQQKLEQEYRLQLENLLLLQDQMKAVLPSGTEEHWKKELEKSRLNLESIKTSMLKLEKHKIALQEEIHKLELRKRNTKLSYDTINGFDRELLQKRAEWKQLQDKYGEKKREIEAQLDKERSLCMAFFKPDVDETASLLTVLYDQYVSIKEESLNIDVDGLTQEKKEAEDQCADIVRQLNEINRKMRELEKQAIMDAEIVGATLAKSYLSEMLRERTFDTVILDEASMASIPALWCASYLAENNIVIVGDFLQLPPIVISKATMAQKWLGKDIFYHSGMAERAKTNSDYPTPANFVKLNEQFRMESDIAEIANIYYGEYGGLHSDDKRLEEKRKQFYEWYAGKKTKSHVHLIDTESLHAWVTGVPQGKGHSRLNFFSAAVAVDFAFKLLENKLKSEPKTPLCESEETEPSVLIIAPYKPHIAYIKQLIELEYKNRGFKEAPNFINAGTIHSFQGSEADIVIFDLVVDEPHWKANLFMNEDSTNEDLKKMFNVAVTRARFKLFIVGNFAFCQKRAKKNALSDLLEKVKDLPKIDAKSLLPDISFARQSAVHDDRQASSRHIVCTEQSFDDYFLHDVHTFKERLIIYSPFMTENRLSTLLPAFTDAVSAGKQITIVTKALSERGKRELGQYQKCEEELKRIGVNILHKKGMHEKLIFVDKDVIWNGSLNALSVTGSTGEIMERYEDKGLADEFEKLLDIEHLCAVLGDEHKQERKCPICGCEMLIKESDKGGIYWQCVNGDYSRNASQQYPADGMMRCKCGAPFVFEMINEPRWVCSINPKHFQKMREDDLKLEKMAALIPTKKQRQEVDRFFIKKRKENEMKKASNKTPKSVGANRDQLTMFEN